MSAPYYADELREVLRRHHPIMRSETGPFSGCRCGQVKLGQDVIAHVLDHLLPVVASLIAQGTAQALNEAAEAIDNGRRYGDQDLRADIGDALRVFAARVAHRYDPETCRCTCGALDHPDWGVTA
jgi:hypothetical protein